MEMSSSSRRILPPGSASRKRKESSSDDFHFLKPQAPPPGGQATKLLGGGGSRPPGPKGNSQVLAGYMAHEFLTKGTLLGEKFDPGRAEAAGVRRRVKQVEVGREEYAEVANIMKAEGTHIPGIVNPTQLSRWIQQMM